MKILLYDGSNVEVNVTIKDHYCIIPHDDLGRLAHAYGVITTIQSGPSVAPFADGVEAVCTVTAKCGHRTVMDIGEANPLNLAGPCQKMYPARVAYLRAKDRAIIHCLDIRAVDDKNDPLCVTSSQEVTFTKTEGRVYRPSDVPDELLFGPYKGQKISDIMGTGKMNYLFNFLMSVKAPEDPKCAAQYNYLLSLETTGGVASTTRS